MADRQEYVESVREQFIYAQGPHWRAYGILVTQMRTNPRLLLDHSWRAEVGRVNAGIKAACLALRAIDAPKREVQLHAFALHVAEREEKAIDLFWKFIQTRQVGRIMEAGKGSASQIAFGHAGRGVTAPHDTPGYVIAWMPSAPGARRRPIGPGGIAFISPGGPLGPISSIFKWSING